MANTPKIENACFVKAVDGKHYVFMPNGDKIPLVVMTKVYDKINEIPYVVLKMYVNIE